MAKYGKTSRLRLSECRIELQDIMNTIIHWFDVSIATGHRGETEQNLLFDKDLTEVKFPDSKHNSMPSDAVDTHPYPLDFKSLDAFIKEMKEYDKEDLLIDYARFYYMAGLIIATAKSKGVEIRWGGDWDRDHTFKDNKFDDLLHFEIIEKEN